MELGFNSLPAEVVLEGVFPYIHPIELWQCRRVCTRWNSWIKTYFRTAKSLSLNDDISEYYITEEGLYFFICSVQLLKELVLDRCYRCATEKLLITMATRCHRLEVLSVPCCREVTDNVLKAIAENCPHIRELNFNRCFQVKFLT